MNAMQKIRVTKLLTTVQKNVSKIMEAIQMEDKKGKMKKGKKKKRGAYGTDA